MFLLILIISCVWILRIGANLLSYAYLWWVKEYRSDRMWVHLHTLQGKKFLTPPFRIPRKSPKSIGLILVCGLLLLSVFIMLGLPILLKLLIVDLLTFPITWVIVIILNFGTRQYHDIQIRNAITILRNHSQMKVIGVTGSFGKTSTKEFLYSILSEKYRVIKTRDSKNSPIGIAEVILEVLRPDDEVFVVEMGAYKKGEIRQMSSMVRPDVGILTAINAQHQDLFGSITTTKSAKYELIQSLNKEGIAIFNADNEGSFELAQRANQEGRKIYLYSKTLKKLPSWAMQIIAKNIKVGENNLTFTLETEDKKFNITLPLLGGHQIQNILAAVSGCVAIGMSMSDIEKGLHRIKQIPKVLEPVIGVNGVRFINDTFNNNPDAAHAALDYLAVTKGKKIVVFQPMIELGEYVNSAHEEVGAHATRVADEILLTNSNWIDSFMKGVRSIDQKKQVQVLTVQEAASFILSHAKRGDTVLFKGKEAEPVLNRLQLNTSS